MAKTTTPVALDVSELELTDEKATRQFVLKVGDHRARIEYDHQGDRIFLTRTDVPKQLADGNVHRVLTEKTLNHVEAHRLKLVPLCPKVKDFLRQNPAWQRLLLKGVQLR
jgi:predicted GNAT family acetyltransferase